MRDIITQRLKLTKWTLSDDDVKGLYDYAKNPNVGPHAGWKPHESLDESREIIKELFIPNDTWSIRLKRENTIIGTIALEKDIRRAGVNSREMGYSLGEEYWGKGYMTEAAKAVIDYGFEELNLVVLAICTGPQNKRSQRVIEKCGFNYDGILRRGYKIFDGTIRDSLLYSMLSEEWEKLK